MTEAHAIRIHETGGPDVLKWEPVEIRQPGAGEALVRQEAVGLNYIDTYHRSGLYPYPMPGTLGTEGAGIVEAVGEGVTRVKPGDRVAYVGGGTYTTHYTGRAATMMKLPDGVSCEQGAALALKGLTAWMLLFKVRPVEAGETALAWAPVGGVGSLLVPWAASLGLRVIGVTSTQDKADKALASGASDVIVGYDKVADEVMALTDGRGVDISYDSVGKSSQAASLASLAVRGWYISFGNASGNAAAVAPGQLAKIGSGVMVRPSLFHFLRDPGDIDRGAAAVFGALRVGTIKAEIGQRFALKDAADAHRAIESGKTVGATVMTV
jgi:NADPH2:quinone reductase